TALHHRPAWFRANDRKSIRAPRRATKVPSALVGGTSHTSYRRGLTVALRQSALCDVSVQRRASPGETYIGLTPVVRDLSKSARETYCLPDASRDRTCRMRLLVVEDNKELGHLLSKGLRSAGFDADLITTAGDARSVLETTRYAALVLDLG